MDKLVRKYQHFEKKALLAALFLGSSFLGCTNQKTHMEDYQEIEKKSVEELREVLRDQSEWVKVHAAEFLLWAGYPDGVEEVFREEEALYAEKSQYRIGVWRVLAQAAVSDSIREYYTGKILEAFLDKNGNDRIHAAETLAKLEISPVKGNERYTAEVLEADNLPLVLYTQWSVAYTSEDSASASRKTFLERVRGSEPAERSISAFSLRKLGGLNENEWRELGKAALEEPDSSSAAVYLLSAALVTAPDGVTDQEFFRKIREKIVVFAGASGKGERMEMAMALAERGGEEDLPLLLSMLRNENPLGKEAEDADVRAAGAYALLKILGRIS